MLTNENSKKPTGATGENGEQNAQAFTGLDAEVRDANVDYKTLYFSMFNSISDVINETEKKAASIIDHSASAVFWEIFEAMCALQSKAENMYLKLTD